PRASIHVIATSAPDDVSGFKRLIESNALDPKRLVAILGKTEGNGCVNDFTRAFAVSALTQCLGADADGVSMVMSGGTEGCLSPHLVTFEVLDESGAGPAMAVGSDISRDLAPFELGTIAQVDCVAASVKTAMASAGLCDPSEVHFVQIKCPLLTKERMVTSQKPVATTDTLKSMGLSRGASALGVAVALGEIDLPTAEEALGNGDQDVWSSKASTSAGVELMGHEVIVFGM
ncbi:unnamed protein product, partial [Ectocarpus sp. 12 AP-2014]